MLTRIASCRKSLSYWTPPGRSLAPRTAEALQAEIPEKLTYSVGKDPIVARPHDWLKATILAVRDRIIDHWMESSRATLAHLRQARLLPEPRIPHRAPDARRDEQYRR